MNPEIGSLTGYVPGSKLSWFPSLQNGDTIFPVQLRSQNFWGTLRYRMGWGADFENLSQSLKS